MTNLYLNTKTVVLEFLLNVSDENYLYSACRFPPFLLRSSKKRRLLMVPYRGSSIMEYPCDVPLSPFQFCFFNVYEWFLALLLLQAVGENNANLFPWNMPWLTCSMIWFKFFFLLNIGKTIFEYVLNKISLHRGHSEAYHELFCHHDCIIDILEMT